MTQKKPWAHHDDPHIAVATRFIDQLANGVIPWHVPWKEIPRYITGCPLDHVNVWLLAHLPYPHSVFLNWKLIKKLKVSVKTGEHGHLAIGIGQRKSKPALYCTEVFNINQVQGFKEEVVLGHQKVTNTFDACSNIIVAMPKFPTILETGSSVHYNFASDMIYMPQRDIFEKDEQYYSALFYALVQSTGHPKRLRRKTCIDRKVLDPKLYNCEQLCVEMGCSYLCSIAGIDTWYLTRYHHDRDGWMNALYRDNALAIAASMYAQEAVNYILNLPPFINPLRTGLHRPPQ